MPKLVRYVLLAVFIVLLFATGFLVRQYLTTSKNSISTVVDLANIPVAREIDRVISPRVVLTNTVSDYQITVSDKKKVETLATALKILDSGPGGFDVIEIITQKEKLSHGANFSMNANLWAIVDYSTNNRKLTLKIWLDSQKMKTFSDVDWNETIDYPILFALYSLSPLYKNGSAEGIDRLNQSIDQFERSNGHIFGISFSNK